MRDPQAPGPNQQHRNPLRWTASKNQPWIVVSPASGTTPTSVTVSVDPHKLPPWAYAYGMVTIAAAGASNSPRVIWVEKNPVGRSLYRPALAFSDSAIGFCFSPTSSRACIKLEEHVQFTSTREPLTWKAVSDQPWIVVQPAGGTTPTDVRVFVDYDKLPPRSGTTTSVSGSFAVSAAGARNSPQTIPVKLQFYSQPLPQ
ncbi:MAG: BACON domain-containing protein [Gemmatimonadales bacterium]